MVRTMNKFKRLPLSIWIAGVATAMVVFVGASIYWGYLKELEKSDQRTVDYALKVVSDLSAEALSFPLATGNSDHLDHYLSRLADYEFVYVIELKDSEGKLLHQKPNPQYATGETFSVYQRSYPIYPPAMLEEQIGSVDFFEPTEKLLNSSKKPIGILVFHLTNYPYKISREQQFSKQLSIFLGLNIIVFLLMVVSLRPIVGFLRSLHTAMNDLSETQQGEALQQTYYLKELHDIAEFFNRFSRDYLTLTQALNTNATDQESLSREIHAARAREDKANDINNRLVNLMKQSFGSTSITLSKMLQFVRRKLENHGIYADYESEYGIAVELAEELQLTMQKLVQFFQSQENPGPINIEVVDLGELFDNISAEYQTICHRKGLVLEVQYCGNRNELSTQCLIDRKRVHEALRFLCDNAIHYTEHGKVQVQWKLIQDDDGSSISLSVKDTGIGIETKDLDHIFEPFYRGINATALRPSGWGVGLALTKQFIDSLDGTIDVRSQLHLGTEVTVDIPISIASTVEHVETFRDQLTETTILVIESGAEWREKISAYARDIGCEVEAVSNAYDGLTRCFAKNFHVVFLGSDLSDLTKESFISKLENTSRLGNTFFIALLGNEENIAQGMVDATLNMPVKRDALVSILIDYVNRRKIDKLITGITER